MNMFNTVAETSKQYQDLALTLGHQYAQATSALQQEFVSNPVESLTKYQQSLVQANTRYVQEVTAIHQEVFATLIPQVPAKSTKTK